MKILTCALASILLLSLTACSASKYRVCDQTNTCRNMTKAEALEAAEVSHEWKDKSTLTLGIAKP
jgi:hypothetical protein